MEGFRNKVEELEAQLDDVESTAGEFESESRKRGYEYHNSLLEIENLRRLQECIKERIKNTNDENANVETKVLNLETKIKECDNENLKLEDKDNEFQDLMSDIEGKLKEEKDKHMELSGVFEEARSRKTLLIYQIDKSKELHKQRDDKLKILQEELQNQNERAGILHIRNEEIFESQDTNEEKMLAKIKTMNARVSELQDTIQEEKNQIVMITEELVKTKRQKEKLKDDLKNLMNEIEALD